MGRPRAFSEEQILQAVELRRSGMSLNQTAMLIAGNSGSGTRESLRRALVHYGFAENPPLKAIYQPRDFSHVPIEWWSEFRGLFWGEGTVFITCPRTGSSFLQPQMSLSLRDDDRDLAHNMHDMLGGSITAYTKRFHSNPETYGTRVVNPQFRWAIVGIPNLYGVLPYMEAGLLPSKKRKEFALMREYCEKRLEMPLKLTSDQKEELIFYYDQLRELKIYRPSC